MSMVIEGSPLLTREEAARYMRMHVRTFSKRVMPYVAKVRNGGRFMYLESDLREFIEKGRVLPDGRVAQRKPAQRAKALPKIDKSEINRLMAELDPDRPKIRLVK